MKNKIIENHSQETTENSVNRGSRTASGRLDTYVIHNKINKIFSKNAEEKGK